MHNRWHPAIPAIRTISAGDLVTADLSDGLAGQIGADTSAADLLSLDFTLTHPLTGPFWIEGAEPGDLVGVEIVDVVPGAQGFTFVIPGLGLLPELTGPFLVHWQLGDGVARSSELPGVEVCGHPFLGVVGVAPSEKRFAQFRLREENLAMRGGTVRMPDGHGAMPTGFADPGLRTAPPRENGGNLDFKGLGAGSRIWLPVEVDGGLLSLGDPHFAQGDGESCGVAIEMAATVTFRIELRKAPSWVPRSPVIEYAAPARRDGGYLATTGIPVLESGENLELDIRAAAQMALRAMIDVLENVHGMSRMQAYVLSSVAADLRIAEAVNPPNALVVVQLPNDCLPHASRDGGHRWP
jgi:formamidase